ncbi:hypothetical protein NPIL_503381 [Nephila pilipes]|uniref:Uncharacterized protein n=1 Tax=Nephila pilipes TaxID=299642 RepID=A0A8X6TRE7_NEPPI|nr:hypothetical protein NPIL_503381 [Nephila pilipes]
MTKEVVENRENRAHDVPREILLPRSKSDRLLACSKSFLFQKFLDRSLISEDIMFEVKPPKGFQHIPCSVIVWFSPWLLSAFKLEVGNTFFHQPPVCIGASFGASSRRLGWSFV